MKSLIEIEREAIVKALRDNEGKNLKVVAEQLGISRSTLYRKLEEHKVTKKERAGK